MGTKKLSQFDWPTGDTSCHGKQISVHTRELAPETDSCNRFAPGVCSLVSNQFDMREQNSGSFVARQKIQKNVNVNLCTHGAPRSFKNSFKRGRAFQDRIRIWCLSFARNRWCTRGSFASRACCRSVLREQAPSRVPYITKYFKSSQFPPEEVFPRVKITRRDTRQGQNWQL